MKTTKHFIWAMFIGLVSMMGFTSCLSDDNGNDNQNNQYRELTTLEKELAVTSAAGNYTGKFYFYNSESKADSVETNVTITASDSVLTTTIPKEALHAFIQRFNVPETTLNVFDQSPAPELKGVLHPYWNQYLEVLYTYIYTYVNNTVTVSFVVDETPHTIEYKFKDILYGLYGEKYLCYAEYSNKVFACNVLLESIKLDDNLFPINACMSLNVKKP